MKPILKFPKIIILTILLSVNAATASEEEDLAAPPLEHPLSGGSLEEEDPGSSSSSSSGEYPYPNNPHPRSRAMYLSQGVEFVFPIGVQYILANVHEQLWPIGTNGFESVLEFPKHKIPVMFSSMINTLKIANFTIKSRIYTGEDEKLGGTTPLRILGTEIVTADFKSSPSAYRHSWGRINEDVREASGGAVEEFIPKGGLYGRTIYPFTKAVYVNSIHYENAWGVKWGDGGKGKFTDAVNISYMELEGLLPFYENEAFLAVAALFKSGTGSVVFLKPKGDVTILQLMLNPTAITQIFDEHFPGWGVKKVRVRVPEAKFTTNSQHYEMLVKRGVNNAFCIHEGSQSRYSLNPIVQTNHVRLGRESFALASITGATLNNEKDLKDWSSSRQREDLDLAPETILEEYTTINTPKEGDEKEEPRTTAVEDGGEEGLTSTAEAADEPTTTKSTSTPTTTTTPTSSPIPPETSPISDAPPRGEVEVEVVEPHADDPVQRDDKVDMIEFNEPFLWFLHAINEEPMFMGVVESFKRYAEETGRTKDNGGGDGSSSSSSSSLLLDKNAWIYEAAKGVLWHCPSIINKQGE